MVVHIGINGFGRIGRIVFRTCFQNNKSQVSAINDPAVDIDYICYLIKFDSTHGRFNNDIIFKENEIIINDIKIKVFHEKLPANIPWQVAGVQYVVEASGMFTNLEKASGHLASKSVKRVIVTAPSVDIPMMILGVNEDKIDTGQKVISCASSTLYCLAPLIKVLEENYGVTEGFITSIHAMTPSLKPLDGLCLRGKHWRDHRSIHQNIIPAATGACKALGKIIPQVKGKMTGLAFRVPIVNVSILDVTIRLNKNTSIEDIIKSIEHARQSDMKNIIKTSTDAAVSSDFLGDANSCILDVNSSLQLTPNFFKLICWYENEYSYACRVIDSVMYSEKCFSFEIMSRIKKDQSFVSNRLHHELNILLSDDQLFITPNCNIKNKLKLIRSRDGCRESKFSNELTNVKLASTYQNSDFIRSIIKEEKINNEIFKIWNDDVIEEEPRDQNSKSLFHTCVAITPPNKTPNPSKIQEHKVEFIAGVHTTENLFKKTDRKECHDNYSEDKKIQVKNNSMSGDYVPCVTRNNYDMQKNKSHINENKLTWEIENEINKNCIEKERNINECLNSEIEHNKQNIKMLENTSKNNQLKFSAGDDGQKNINSKEIDSNINDEFTYFEKNLNILSNKDNNEDKNYMIHKDSKNNVKYTLEIFEGPIKSNYNNFKINEYNNDNNNFECGEEILDYQEKSDMQTKINTICDEAKIAEMQSQILRSVNTNTTISNGNREGNFPDIYDKLDSVSATDSENSFQIKERKSQIINIIDLTASVEDLARLDKICKIIEISDELSDRLFSALDDNNQKLKRKKWSFKDLCERLKLDEFCSNVFGESTF